MSPQSQLPSQAGSSRSSLGRQGVRMCCCVWEGRKGIAPSVPDWAMCSITTRNDSLIFCSYSFIALCNGSQNFLWSACPICCHCIQCAVTLSLFPKSLLLPWVIWMESWRGGWDKLSMAASLTATLDLKPFKVFAQIPSISCILYLPFQVSCILVQGICATWWPIPIPCVHGFAAQLVKAEC